MHSFMLVHLKDNLVYFTYFWYDQYAALPANSIGMMHVLTVGSNYQAGIISCKVLHRIIKYAAFSSN